MENVAVVLTVFIFFFIGRRLRKMIIDSRGRTVKRIILSVLCLASLPFAFELLLLFELFNDYGLEVDYGHANLFAVATTFGVVLLGTVLVISAWIERAIHHLKYRQ